MLHNIDYDETYELETNSTVNSDDSYDSSDDFQNNSNNISVINSKYKLLIPEIFNKSIHGISLESDPNINGQLMIIEYFTYKSNMFIDELFYNANKICKFYKKCYYEKCNNLKHDYIRNYYNIIKSSNYIKPEIGEIHYLRGDECICILKTFWIKIIQRAWKKIYKTRQQIFRLRCRPDSILYRQITGKFPNNCNFMPSIRGMLL
jgi:hypothetical protein